MADRLQIRRDTAANWTSANPILAQGEWGYELDENRLKIGDGVLDWINLPYFAGGGSGYVVKDPFNYSGSSTFTLSETPSDIISVFLNGQELASDGIAYTLSGNDVVINYDLFTDDFIQVVYTVGNIGGSAVTTAQAESIFDTRLNIQKDQDGGIAANDTSILSLDNVADLSTSNRINRTRAYVNGGGQGGSTFTYIPVGSGLVADGGIYFDAADGGLWKRDFEGDTDPRWFAGVGDGTSDDSDAIEAILSTGFRVSSSDENTFLVTRNISIADKDINIENLKIKLDHTSLSGESAFSFTNTPILTGDVDNSTTIPEHSKTITLDSSAGIIIGDLIKIYCEPQTSGSILNNRTYVITQSGGNFASVGAANNDVGTSFVSSGTSPSWGTGALLILWDFDPRPGETNVTLGEMHQVIGISGNVITLGINIMDRYDSTFNLKYNIYRPKNVILKNITLESDQADDFGSISISGCSPIIENCKLIKSSGRTGISLSSCYMSLVSRVTIQDGYYSGSTTGYGIQDNGSTGTKITGGCQFLNNRRGVDFSGSTPAKLGVISDSTFISNNSDVGSCAGSHGGADLITYSNNDFIGGILGLQIRSPRNTIIGNRFRNNSIANIIVSFGNHLYVEGNQVLPSTAYSANTTGFFVQISSDTTFTREKPAVIQNNSAPNLKVSFLRLSAGHTLTGLVLKNNFGSFRSNSSGNTVGLISASSGSEATLINSCISGNLFKTWVGINEDLINTNINRDRSIGDLLRKITNASLTAYGVGGTIDNKVVEVRQSANLEGWATVTGRISFDVLTDPTNIVLDDLQRSNLGLTYAFYSQEGHILSVINSGLMYIGYAIGSAYNEKFPVGSHVVNFSISYKLRDTYTY